MPFRTITAAAGLALTALAAAGCTQAPTAAPDAVVVADFSARIKDYVAMRNTADNGAPPLRETRSAAKITAAQDALADRIRVARAGARRGDIFTPDIQKAFVALLRPPLKGPAGAETKEVMDHDNPGKLALTINGKYPDEAPLSTVPPNVLAALPPLPQDLGLDYRFVDRHLILRDTKANLIVDFIANAIR